MKEDDPDSVFLKFKVLIPAWDDDLQQDVRDGQRPGSLSQSGTGGFDTYLALLEKMKMFQCDLEEGGGFMFHTCYNEEDLEPYNCKRSQFEISVSGKRQVLLFSEKDLSSCLRILEILRLVINSAT